MNTSANILTAAVVGAATTIAAIAGLGVLATGVVAAGAAHGMFVFERRRHASALTRRKEQLAHTAHELRTPLTSILTAIEMVRGGYATNQEETDEFLAEADLAARHLGFLVNDVLDEAALTAGQLRIELGDHKLQQIVVDALALLGMHAQRRGLTIETSAIDGELQVHADARRVLQVLFNLLGNAVKFSAPGDPIRIDVSATADRVRIAIVDSGPGVPRDLRPRLFQPFGRGDTRGVVSTGLGLHITKCLVELMRGAIGYLPRPLRGSEFWFELPRSRAPQAAVAPDPVAAR
jgi:signal transduction histidine kinase